MRNSLLKTTFDAFKGIVGSTNTDFTPTQLTHIEVRRVPPQFLGKIKSEKKTLTHI